jgi:hypothetical protein
MKIARGTSYPFEATFVDQDGEGLVPDDPASTPQVQVKDPEGNILKTGLGKPVSFRDYVFEWFCPTEADLNVPERKYSVEWFFNVLGGSTRTHSDDFDVIDRVEPSPEEKQQTYISLPGKSERLFFRTEQDPIVSQGSVELDIYGPSNTLIASVNEVTKDSEKLKPDDPNRLIGVMEVDGEYVYYYDTDALTEGEYLASWGLRMTAVSNKEYEQQLLRVPHLNFWRINPSLRMVIDKLKKKIGWVQSYSDSDILEYLYRGLGTVNAVKPNTNWSFGTIPTVADASSGIADAILLAATMHALTAQQILEIELSFNHSGQTVTLDYSHDYGSVLSNINDMFNKFVEAKERLYRVACGPGVVGVRVMRNRFYGQRVYKLDGDHSDGDDWFNPAGLIARAFT